MTKTRKDIVNNTNELSIFDLPNNLLRIPEGKTEGVSITSVVSEKDATTVMRKLSDTSTTLHIFFKPELKKRRQAKELLNHVLQGTSEDKEKVIAAAKTHPELFFIKATTYDGAMDLEGNRRLIDDWSTYQALFGTGDVDMLASVKQDLDAYLATLNDGHKKAEDQLKEKFPNGLDFPESDYDFSPLLDAITNDQQLIQTDKPNQTTNDALQKFRNDFKPGIVKTGHHFNMNVFLNADKSHLGLVWNAKQIIFFNKYVKAFLQRLMTRFYLMSTCQGLKNLERESFKRCLEVDDRIDNPIYVMKLIQAHKFKEGKKLVVVPLDLDPSCRLGEDFIVDGYSGWGSQHDGGLLLVYKYVEQTQQALKTYAATKTSVAVHDRISVKHP